MGLWTDVINVSDTGFDDGGESALVPIPWSPKPRSRATG